MTVALPLVRPWWGFLQLVFAKGLDVLAPPSDTALVVEAQRKGPAGKAAFERLVERYHAVVYRQLYRLLRSPDLADDVTQDTFVKAYLDLPKLRDPATFPKWLRTIATRLAFNSRRSEKTRDGYEDRAERAKAEGGGAPADPEAYTGAAEVVWKTLGELSYPYREILVLRYLEELTVEEIAEHLGLGKSAAKMRLKRARDDFKALAGAGAG